MACTSFPERNSSKTRRTTGPFWGSRTIHTETGIRYKRDDKTLLAIASRYPAVALRPSVSSSIGGSHLPALCNYLIPPKSIWSNRLPAEIRSANLARHEHF